jgi:hypothetical protein
MEAVIFNMQGESGGTRIFSKVTVILVLQRAYASAT